MSRDAGYTLVEMLAALAVISMAFGGLAAGSHILLRQQRGASSDVATSEGFALAQRDLEAALGKVKTSDVRFADARRIEIACWVGESCEARTLASGEVVSSERVSAGQVAITAAPGYRFAFWTATGRTPIWSAESKDKLAGVTLTSERPRATPIAVVRLREEQAFRCEYDVVIVSCREPAQ